MKKINRKEGTKRTISMKKPGRAAMHVFFISTIHTPRRRRSGAFVKGRAVSQSKDCSEGVSDVGGHEYLEDSGAAAKRIAGTGSRGKRYGTYLKESAGRRIPSDEATFAILSSEVH